MSITRLLAAGRKLAQSLGRERVTTSCCAVGSGLALFVERDVLMNGPPAAQLGTIALAIVVPILYLTPLIWLLFRLIVNQPTVTVAHLARNSNPEKK